MHNETKKQPQSLDHGEKQTADSGKQLWSNPEMTVLAVNLDTEAPGGSGTPTFF